MTETPVQHAVDVLADHVRGQAGELTVLDVGDRIPVTELRRYDSPTMLIKRAQALRNRLAVDAYTADLAIIASTPVRYRVRPFQAEAPVQLPYTGTPPELDELSSADEVEISIEALAVPIMVRGI